MLSQIPKQLDKFDLKGFVKPKKLYQVKDDQDLMLSDQLMRDCSKFCVST